MDSVADLHALLRAGGIEGPYVLVGASFGGLLAYMYAATYPDDVAGMLLLDGNLPTDPELEAAFGFPFLPDEWTSTTEQLSRLSTYEEAVALEGEAPDIPMVYLAVAEPDPYPRGARADQLALINEKREEFVSLFPQGSLEMIDAPHYMEPLIPDRIAEEVRVVIDATKG